jgi:hypothetical protein
MALPMVAIRQPSITWRFVECDKDRSFEGRGPVRISPTFTAFATSNPQYVPLLSRPPLRPPHDAGRIRASLPPRCSPFVENSPELLVLNLIGAKKIGAREIARLRKRIDEEAS